LTIRSPLLCYPIFKIKFQTISIGAPVGLKNVGARQILTISIKMLVLALKLDAKDLFYLLAWFSDETNLCCAEISAAFLILLNSFLSF